MEGIVVYTNVFVAAGFNARSASERLLAAVRHGRFQLIWNKPTQRKAGEVTGTSWFTGSVACSGFDNPESDPASPFRPQDSRQDLSQLSPSSARASR